MTSRPGRIVVIGVGNEFRHDDGVGPRVIERLRGRLPGEVELVVTDGDAVRLIEAWSGASLAVVVDAVRAEPPSPGRLHSFIVSGSIVSRSIVSSGSRVAGGTGPGAGQARPGARQARPDAGAAGSGSGEARPGIGWPGSTHAFGLDEAVGLASALDRMPQRLVVHAIEAADLTLGIGMTPAVAAAIGAAAAAVRHDILGPHAVLSKRERIASSTIS